jgi:hypothetical protein
MQQCQPTQHTREPMQHTRETMQHTREPMQHTREPTRAECTQGQGASFLTKQTTCSHCAFLRLHARACLCAGAGVRDDQHLLPQNRHEHFIPGALFARTGPLRTARGCFEGEFSAPVSWQVKEVCTAEAETAASAEKEAVVITLRMFSLHSLSQI